MTDVMRRAPENQNGRIDRTQNSAQESISVLNQPLNRPEKKKGGFWTRKKIVASVAGSAFALTGGVLGLRALGNDRDAVPAPQPTVAISPTPSPEFTPKSAAELEQERLEAESEADEDIYNVMRKKPITEFNGDTLEDRLKFVHWRYAQIIGDTDTIDFFTDKVDARSEESVENQLAYYNPILWEQDTIPSDQEILYMVHFAEQAANVMFDPTGEPNAAGDPALDRDAAIKMGSGYALSTESRTFRSFTRPLLKQTHAQDVFVKNFYEPEERVGEGMVGVELNGEIVDCEYRDIRYQTAVGEFTERFVAIPATVTALDANYGEYRKFEFMHWLNAGSEAIEQTS